MDVVPAPLGPAASFMSACCATHCIELVSPSADPRKKRALSRSSLKCRQLPRKTGFKSTQGA
eukprot:5503911-Pleurochrysis_carterae.AAC.1